MSLLINIQNTRLFISKLNATKKKKKKNKESINIDVSIDNGTAKNTDATKSKEPRLLNDGVHSGMKLHAKLDSYHAEALPRKVQLRV